MFEPLENESRVAPQTMRLLLSLIVVVAFIGFFVGIRQLAPLDLTDPSSDLATKSLSAVDHGQSSPDTAIPSTHYGNYDRRKLGPNRVWTNEFVKLEQSERNLMANYSEDPAREHDPTAQAAYLKARTQRRAFDGAPPVVPHPIDQLTTTSCVVCHEKGRDIGKGVRAPMIPHPLYVNCTQCHAESVSVEFAYEPLAENHFTGLLGYGAGSRAGEGAPPVIPHSTWMRENCMSCHQREGASPIRTSHPWRTNCTQCHAPSAEMDQLFTDLTPEIGLWSGKSPETSAPAN